MGTAKPANVVLNGVKHIYIATDILDYINKNVSRVRGAVLCGDHWYIDPNNLCHLARALVGYRYIKQMLRVDYIS